MKQRYNEYSHELAYKAVDACFNRKWMRRDILAFIEEFAGIDRSEIYNDTLHQAAWAKIEATDAIAYLIDQMIDDILNGREIEEIDPVIIKSRPDGMTFKMRDIASLSIPHQLLGHVVKLGLEPLLKARILPTQYASIPGRGQTKLKKQIGWFLRKKKLNINYSVKTDIVHAYGSLRYEDVLSFVKYEIPSATWIIKSLEYLGKLAPGNHLIIGGYIDAWLFNFMMSYAMRDLQVQGCYRREKFHPYVVRVITYMDDFAILTETRTGARKAIICLSKWFRMNLNLSIKQTSSIFELYSIEDERRAKNLSAKSSKGCPAIDMGGYIIHRSYVTIRPRIFKRIARSFKKAYNEILKTGTLRKDRANNIISRFGYIKQSSSKSFQYKYHIHEVLTMAKHVDSFWSKIHSLETKEWLINAVDKYQSCLAAC